MPDLNLGKYILFIPFMLFLSGCSKQEIIPDAHHDFYPQGKELEDPFAIHNILKAYHNLQAADSSVPDCEIRANNVYVRFLPGDAHDIETLRSDTTIDLYDYPLNYDYGDVGAITDSFPPDKQKKSFYCVVPVGQELPAVPYEIIYEVFIPPSGESTVKSSSGEMPDFYEKLVNESARLTGNLAGDDTAAHMSLRSSQDRWSPKGRIRVWDDLLNMYIPLNHVNVHARWFTHIEKALTDEEGYFQMKSFRYKVNYSIKWENSLFTIRDGLIFQAWYNGPRKKGDWMLDISGGKSKMFATIHRAAYRQFYGDNLGLARPVLPWGGRTKICYLDGDGTGQFNGDYSAGGILPDIQIWGNNATKQTNFIFSTVSHELGHQLHSLYIGNLRYMKVSKIIRESWAEAVEWVMTNDEYHKLGNKYGVTDAIKYDHQYSKHTGWPYVSDRSYSPAFIDLVDDFNQGEAFGYQHPNDLISHYTISFINFNILLNTTDISTLGEEVRKHKIEGVDDFKIRELYLLY